MVDTPDQLHSLDARCALCRALYKLLRRGEAERDSTASDKEERAREARKVGEPRSACSVVSEASNVRAAGWLTIRPFHQYPDGRYVARLGLARRTRNVVELPAPPPSLLDHERHPLGARPLARARDGVWVRLAPAVPAHAPGEHAQADELPRAPARVQRGHAHERRTELGDRLEVRLGCARFDEAEDVVGAVEARGDGDVRDGEWLVQAGLGFVSALAN